eukprot:scaffold85887_cov74-Phaeocystis_antarctica.AAC.1
MDSRARSRETTSPLCARRSRPGARRGARSNPSPDPNPCPKRAWCQVEPHNSNPNPCPKQAWCQVEPCVSDPLVNLVHERVVNLTGVPKPNAEFFQVHARGIAAEVAVAVAAAAAAAAAPAAPAAIMTQCTATRTTHAHALHMHSSAVHARQVLRYEPGQFYKVHHDQNASPQGQNASAHTHSPRGHPLAPGAHPLWRSPALWAREEWPRRMDAVEGLRRTSDACPRLPKTPLLSLHAVPRARAAHSIVTACIRA